MKSEAIQKKLEPVRILVVEDEGIIALEIQKQITALGYQVAGRVSSAEEAVATVLTMLPSLVLMDVRLAGPGDGISAAREIRRKSNIPIVFLSAFGMEDLDAREVRRLAAAVLSKPFTQDDLASVISQVLGLSTYPPSPGTPAAFP